MSIAEIKKPGRRWTLVFDGFLIVLYGFGIVSGGEGGIGGFPGTGGQGRGGARKDEKDENENFQDIGEFMTELKDLASERRGPRTPCAASAT